MIFRRFGAVACRWGKRGAGPGHPRQGGN